MKKIPILILPLFFPLTSNANWYLGGNAGIADTDVSSSELNSRLAKEGLSGTADIDKSQRLGWRLFGGYQWGKHLALEGGYTDLGNIEASYIGTASLTAQNLQAIFPPSASGYELSLLGRYPFNEKLSAFIRGGAFAWHSEYSGSGGSSKYTGTDPLIGIGGEWQFADRWSLRLAWDRYTVAKDDTDLLSLGVSYHFADHSPKTEPTEKNAETPAPKTLASTVQTPPPAVEASAEKPAITEPTPVEATPPAPPTPAPLAPKKWQVLYGFEAVEPIEAESELAAAVEDLSTHPQAVVTITGYADTTGPESYNITLSLKRAELLAAKLVKSGVAVDRITTEGKGSSDPIADNGTREGRARNRRAVILVHEPYSPQTAQKATRN